LKVAGTAPTGTASVLWQWQSEFQEWGGDTSSLSPALPFCLTVGADGNPAAVFEDHVVKLLGNGGTELWSSSISNEYNFVPTSSPSIPPAM
jgi:hypothetical protein